MDHNSKLFSEDSAPDRAVDAPSPETLERDHLAKVGKATRFGTGNMAALKTGAYSQLIRSGEYAGSKELLAEARAELYEQLGGNLSTVLRSMADAFIELGAVRDYLGGRLASEGPLTAKGYTRALLTAYLSVIDRQVKLAQILGLERRIKPIDLAQAFEQQDQR